VKLMQPLQHPNIIRYLDSFIGENELIIVTEWAQQGDLKRLIKIAKHQQIPFDEYKIWEFMF
jgi:serine/threonine protein kinase